MLKALKKLLLQQSKSWPKLATFWHIDFDRSRMRTFTGYTPPFRKEIQTNKRRKRFTRGSSNTKKGKTRFAKQERKWRLTNGAQLVPIKPLTRTCALNEAKGPHLNKCIQFERCYCTRRCLNKVSRINNQTDKRLSCNLDQRTMPQIPTLIDTRMDVGFSSAEIHTALTCVKRSSPPGPDNISYSVLVHLGPVA